MNCRECGKDITGSHRNKLFCPECKKSHEKAAERAHHKKYYVPVERTGYHSQMEGGIMRGTGDLDCYDGRRLPLGAIKAMARDGWAEGLRVEVGGKVLVVANRKLVTL
jgi:hypothetical protein